MYKCGNKKSVLDLNKFEKFCAGGEILNRDESPRQRVRPAEPGQAPGSVPGRGHLRERRQGAGRALGHFGERFENLSIHFCGKLPFQFKIPIFLNVDIFSPTQMLRRASVDIDINRINSAGQNHFKKHLANSRIMRKELSHIFAMFFARHLENFLLPLPPSLSCHSRENSQCCESSAFSLLRCSLIQAV